jgi:hypothetical protein
MVIIVRLIKKRFKNKKGVRLKFILHGFWNSEEDAIYEISKWRNKRWNKKRNDEYLMNWFWNIKEDYFYEIRKWKIKWRYKYDMSIV